MLHPISVVDNSQWSHLNRLIKSARPITGHFRIEILHKRIGGRNQKMDWIGASADKRPRGRQEIKFQQKKRKSNKHAAPISPNFTTHQKIKYFYNRKKNYV